MKSYLAFGRITATKEQCTEIIKTFFDSEDCLACYEKADDGCSRNHSHFIARCSFKNFKSLRQSFSDKCYKILGERLQYSIKEYDQEKDAEAYICKGHKKDASITPDIFINSYNTDVEECYNRFHKVQAQIKETQKTVCVWKEVVNFINKRDDKLLTGKVRSDTAWKIADFLFDYYMSRGKMIQGKYVQQCIIRTIIANSFKSKTVKGQIITDWVTDLYINEEESEFKYQETKVYSYDTLHDPADDIL